MKNDLVVKDNALINASYNLEVTEQRLILLSIIRARETGQGISSDSKLEIHASDYASRFDVTKEAAYNALKNAVNNLWFIVNIVDNEMELQKEDILHSIHAYMKYCMQISDPKQNPYYQEMQKEILSKDKINQSELK